MITGLTGILSSVTVYLIIMIHIGLEPGDGIATIRTTVTLIYGTALL